MKTSMLVVGALLALAPAARAVNLGDAPDRVRAELGDPTGELRSGDRLLYAYDRGEVEFRFDRAVRVELVSAEVAEQRRIAAEAERERQMRWATAQYEARLARGRAALDAARADPTLEFRSASDQVAFWRSFRMQYPEVPVDAEYAQALRRLDIETLERRAAAAEQRRIEELEERVQYAENRLYRAENRGIHLNPAYYGTYGYGYYPVAYPVTVVRRSCRPPPCLTPRRTDCGTSGISLTIRGDHTLVRGGTALVRN